MHRASGPRASPPGGKASHAVLRGHRASLRMRRMRIPLKPEAVRSFRLLTELSLMLGVIDEEKLEDRMAYLSELLGNPGNGPSNPFGTGGGGRDEEPRRASGEEAPGEEAHGDILKGHQVGGPPPPDWFQLIPRGAIGHLQKWHFIKGDPDPLPSVPHGHDEGRSFPKLDPYLGWIHASTRQTAGRLSQDDTRALWNDEGFRDFASAALIHFAQENPNYTWRVSYPMRLPRRR